MQKVYRFSIEYGWADSTKSWPIYDEYMTLVGAFTVGEGGRLNCFIGGSESPISLKVSSNEFFYATPVSGPHGQTEQIIVSEYNINLNSIKVKAEES